jgi:uncharacterized protein YjbI with pentapeptide repeats
MRIPEIVITLLLSLGVAESMISTGIAQPVPKRVFQFKDIPGTELSCGSYIPKGFQGGHCKFVIDGETLIVFIEKDSQEIRIPLENIFASITRTPSVGGQVGGYIGYISDSELPSGNRVNFLDFEKVVTDFKLPDIGAFIRIRREIIARYRSGSMERSQLASKIQAMTAVDRSQNLTEQIKQLTTFRSCIRCDLRGANLENLDLRKANLEGANLQGANLSGSNLEDANFIGAVLDDADLSKANLKVAFFSFASMQRTKLTGSELNGSRFQLADLEGANLDQTSFREAKFLPVDFTGANLRRASLVKATLRDALMTGTNLQDANLPQAVFYKSQLSGTNLQGANLQQAIFDWSRLDGTNLQGANLSGSNFNHSSLSRANFQNANLSDIRFKRVFTQEVNFQNADLRRGRFDGSLTSANLRNARIEEADLTEAQFCNVTMPDGSISNQNCKK